MVIRSVKRAVFEENFSYYCKNDWKITKFDTIDQVNIKNKLKSSKIFYFYKKKMPKKSVIPQKFSKTDNLWVLPKICKSGQSDVGQSVVYDCRFAYKNFILAIVKLSKSLSLKCRKNLKSTEHCKNCWKQNSTIIWTLKDWISFLIRIKGIEIVTLLVIGGMALLETWLVGIKSLRRKPWIIFLLISVIISLIDVFIDLSKSQDNSETFLRLRRLLRPFIFIQSSLGLEILQNIETSIGIYTDKVQPRFLATSIL